MAHAIELRRPTPEENNRKWDGEHYTGESFDRGERIIMVNGERWGRTVVTHHGCNGTKHTICQHGAGPVIVEPDKKYPQEAYVRSEKRRRWLGEADSWKPTEEKVLDKVLELVASGKLRHPDIVRKEQAAANKRYRERRQAADRKRAEEFRAKAMEALQINDPASEIIDRIVVAMEWAQQQ